MSHYASRLRWQERGIKNKGARERAPGFGRLRWTAERPHYDNKENVDSNSSRACSGAGGEEPAKMMQNWYLHNALYLANGVSFWDASVSVVLDWASKISGTEISCSMEWLLWGQEGSADEGIAAGEEQILWEKLKILLTAAILATDDEPHHFDAQRPTAGLLTTKKKLMILYAAYFELCPESILNPPPSVDATEISGRAARLRQVMKRSTRLHPRSLPGVTPLAIAAGASATTLPSSRFSPGPHRAAFDPTRDHLTLSRRVIDRLLALSPSAASVPSQGQLPLHLAVRSGKSWEDGIGSVYAAYPEAIDTKDESGALPIHYAAGCSTTLPVVIRFLVKLSPRTVQVRDSEGRLPLHLAAENGKAWTGGVSDIFKSFPEAAVMPDKKGKLPAYYRVKTDGDNNAPDDAGGDGTKSQLNTTLVQTLLQNMVGKQEQHRRERQLQQRGAYNVTSGIGAIILNNQLTVAAPFLPTTTNNTVVQIANWATASTRQTRAQDGEEDEDHMTSGTGDGQNIVAERQIRRDDWEKAAGRICV